MGNQQARSGLASMLILTGQTDMWNSGSKTIRRLKPPNAFFLHSLPQGNTHTRARSVHPNRVRTVRAPLPRPLTVPLSKATQRLELWLVGHPPIESRTHTQTHPPQQHAHTSPAGARWGPPDGGRQVRGTGEKSPASHPTPAGEISRITGQGCAPLSPKHSPSPIKAGLALQGQVLWEEGGREG